MALKATINATEFSGMAADMQSHYAAQEGGDYLLAVDATSGFELANTANLKNTLVKERARADKAEAGIKDFSVQFDGIDPKTAREALQKVSEMGDWDPEKKLAEAKSQFEKQMTEKYEGERGQLVKKHDFELGNLNTKFEAARTQLSKALITSAAKTAITEANGSVDLLSPIIERHVRMVEKEDGQFRAEVVGPDGVARLSPKSGSMEPMTIEELVSEFRGNDKYGRAFDASGSTGAGGPGSSVHTSPGSVAFISAIDAKSPAKYRAAKEAATKIGRTLEIKG